MGKILREPGSIVKQCKGGRGGDELCHQGSST